MTRFCKIFLTGISNSVWTEERSGWYGLTNLSGDGRSTSSQRCAIFFRDVTDEEEPKVRNEEMTKVVKEGVW